MKITERVKSGMTDKDYLRTLCCVVNPEANGGESIAIEVDVFKNEDNELYTNTSIEANCYGSHSTTMNLGSHDKLANAFSILAAAISGIALIVRR